MIMGNEDLVRETYVMGRRKYKNDVPSKKYAVASDSCGEFLGGQDV